MCVLVLEVRVDFIVCDRVKLVDIRLIRGRTRKLHTIAGTKGLNVKSTLTKNPISYILGRKRLN